MLMYKLSVSTGKCNPLEAQPQRQLNLPRVVNGPWRPVVGIRRALAELLCRRASLSCRVERAEIGGSIHRIEEPHIDGVEQIEGFGQSLHVKPFRGFEGARQSQVDA